MSQLVETVLRREHAAMVARFQRADRQEALVQQHKEHREKANAGVADEKEDN